MSSTYTLTWSIMVRANLPEQARDVRFGKTILGENGFPICAERGRRRGTRRRTERRTHVTQGTRGSAIDRHEHLARLVQRMRRELFQLEHRLEQAVVRGERGHPLVARLRDQDRLDLLANRV